MRRRTLLTGAGSTAVVSGVLDLHRARAANPDAALLSACADFRRAHADQMALSDIEPWNEGAIDKVVTRWYAALQSVLDAPVPHTSQGTAALTEVAWIALLDQAANETNGGSQEGRVALKALAAVGGAA